MIVRPCVMGVKRCLPLLCLVSLSSWLIIQRASWAPQGQQLNALPPLDLSPSEPFQRNDSLNEPQTGSTQSTSHNQASTSAPAPGISARPSASAQPTVRVPIFIYDDPFFYNVSEARYHCVSDKQKYKNCAAERVIHQRLKRHPWRTRDPNAANVLFYVPYYAAAEFFMPSVAHLRDSWSPSKAMHRSNEGPVNTLSLPEQLLSRLTYLKRRQGKDHVWLFTHDYGPCFHYTRYVAKWSRPDVSVMEGLVLSSLGDKNMPSCFRPTKDMSVPTFVEPQLVVRAGSRRKKIYEACSSAGTGGNYNHEAWQDSALLACDDQRRSFLVTYHGSKAHKSIRSVRVKVNMVMQQAAQRNLAPSTVRNAGVVSTEDYQDEMFSSHFCLCPAGYAPWSTRPFTAMQTGCIPVLISDDIVPPFQDLFNWTLFSVQVPERSVAGTLAILKAITTERRLEMRRELYRVAPHFTITYATVDGDTQMSREMFEDDRPAERDLLLDAFPGKTHFGTESILEMLALRTRQGTKADAHNDFI